MRGGRRRKRLDGLHAVAIDDQQFARLDITQVRRADQVHRACLRTDDVRIVQAAQRERTEPVRIADRNQAITVSS